MSQTDCCSTLLQLLTPSLLPSQESNMLLSHFQFLVLPICPTKFSTWILRVEPPIHRHFCHQRSFQNNLRINHYFEPKHNHLKSHFIRQLIKKLCHIDLLIFASQFLLSSLTKSYVNGLQFNLLTFYQYNYWQSHRSFKKNIIKKGGKKQERKEERSYYTIYKPINSIGTVYIYQTSSPSNQHRSLEPS